MRALIVLLVALFALPGIANAQTCPGLSPQVSVINGFSPSQPEDYTRLHLQFDFYARTQGTTQSHLYTQDETYPDGTDYGLGVRFDTDRTIKFRTWDANNTIAIWGCDDGAGNTTCPAYNASDWYHIVLDWDQYANYYTASVENCDDGLVVYAKNFRAYNDNSTTWRTQSWRIQTTSLSEPFEIASATWTRLYDIKPNCEYPTFCISPVDCQIKGEIYQACVPEKVPFCDNQPLPPEASGAALPPNALDELWELVLRFYEWIVSLIAGSPAGAVANGRVPTDHYGTVKATPSGIIIGPHAYITAGHGTLIPGPVGEETINRFGWRLSPVDPATFVSGHSRFAYREDIGVRTFAYRCVSPRLGTSTATSTIDMTICFTKETLPPPYISELYDATTQSANCDNILLQGHTAGGPNRECDFWVDTVQSFPVENKQYYGLCLDPIEALTSGGDSGGPAYAIGDWDGAGPGGVYAKLFGIHGSGNSWTSFNTFNATATQWFNDNLTPTTVPLLPNAGFGIDVQDAWGQHHADDGTGHDITVAPYTFTSHIQLAANASPVDRVSFYWESTDAFGAVLDGRESCVDTVPGPQGEYSCRITLPKGGGSIWQLNHILVETVAGEKLTLDRITLGKFGAMGFYSLPLGIETIAPDTVAPSVSADRLQILPSPGGLLRMDLTATDTADEPTPPSGTEYLGVNYKIGNTKISCVVPSENLVEGQVNVCDVQVPLTVSPGDLVTVPLVYARDYARNLKQVSFGTRSTTIFDCAEPNADLEITNGWLPSQSTVNASGQNPRYSFWARASSTSAEGYVLLGEQTVTNLTPKQMGIRFSSLGNIEVRADGVWQSDVPTPYQAGVWYKFTLNAQHVTDAGSSWRPNNYEVTVEACGVPSRTLLSGPIPIGDGSRLLNGIDSWGAYAAAGQTIGVYGMTLEPGACIPTRCLYGEDFCTADAPDGCGGVIVDTSPCVTCGGGTPTCDTDWVTCVP